jgi:protein TonB
VAHAVSAFSARYEHISPVAAVLSTALHVATALALFWVSPLNRHDVDVEDDAQPIEVTIEQPKPPEPPPPTPEASKPTPPPSPPAAPPSQPPAAEQPSPPPPPPPAVTAKLQPEIKPQPQPQTKSNVPLGITPEAPKTGPEPKTPEAKLDPQPEPEAKAQPTQEATAVAPPVEPKPPTPQEEPLEKVLPPVEAPAAPLSMRDFVKVVPPPPAPPPSPPAARQAPPPQHTAPQTLQHSPLSTPQQSSSQMEANANPSVSTFVNPAAAAAQTRAKDAYIWQVLHKFAQYLPDLRGNNEGGTAVLRFVIARDGRLVEASIAQSSGVTALDRGLLDSLRAGSPYPPLPPEIPGAQAVFTQPIGAARR